MSTGPHGVSVHLIGIVDQATVAAVPLPDRNQIEARMRALALDGLCHILDWHPERPVVVPDLAAWGRAPRMVCWRLPKISGARDDGIGVEQTMPLFDQLLSTLGENPIRLDGRPLFAVYRLDALADPRACAAAWRARARDSGVGEIALAGVHFRWQGDPRLYDFDAAIALPPLACRAESRTDLAGVAVSALPHIPLYHYRGLACQRLQASRPPYRLLEAVPSGVESLDVEGVGHFLPIPGASPAALAAWLSFALPKARLRAGGEDCPVFLAGAGSLLVRPEAETGLAALAGAVRSGIDAAVPLPEPVQPLPEPDAVLAESAVIDNPAWEAGFPGPDTVSVIVPSYNHAAYLRGAIESVLAQTWPEVELIVVDDGSGDGSPALLRELLASSPRPMRLVLQGNRGAHEAINRGLALARGAYLAILNSDDAYMPDRLAVMLAALRDSGAVLAFSDVQPIDRDGRPLPVSHPFVASLGPLLRRVRQTADEDDRLLVLASMNAAISTGNFVFRRDLLDRIGGMRAMVGNHDWDFLLASATVAAPVFVDRPLYRYRLHGTNTITQHNLRSAIEAECCRFRLFSLKPMRIGHGHVLAAWSAAPGRKARSRHYSDWLLHAREGAAPKAAPTPATAPISILLPTFNTPEIWLRRCLDSVLAQTWPDWELCVADDASTEPRVRAVLEEYAGRDARIRLIFRNENGHISVASNSALELVRGRFFALLDHDDELPPDALARVAAEIEAHPEAELIYSDEDKIDEFGVRFQPNFKPDYNPELLRAQNCISHLGVFRTDRVRALGGFRAGFEGAQDWDLALRVCDSIRPEQVRHIPRVLYHWRAIQNSTSLSLGVKPYVVKAQRQALADHLARKGWRATLFQPENLYHWGVRMDAQAASPWTFVFDLDSSTVPPAQWLDAVLARSPRKPDAILLLAAAEPVAAVAEVLARANPAPPCRWLRTGAGKSRAEVLSTALAENGSGMVFLLGGGVLPTAPEGFGQLAARAGLAETGIVGVKAVTPEQRIAYAGTLLLPGGRLGMPSIGQGGATLGYIGRAFLAQNYTVLQGPCLVFDAAKLARLGEWTVPVVAHHFEVELSLRFHRAGLRNLWLPHWPFLLPAIPADDAALADDARRLADLWPEAFGHDPAYNPNLSVGEPLFELAATDAGDELN